MRSWIQSFVLGKKKWHAKLSPCYSLYKHYFIPSFKHSCVFSFSDEDMRLREAGPLVTVLVNKGFHESNITIMPSFQNVT
jgi:hypothetical protein